MSLKSASKRILFLALAVASCSVMAAAKPAGKPDDVFKHLEFRNLGPASAGGRVSSVAGIPGDPRVYYVGAAGGGVFKTTDGGLHWKAIFEHEATSSIGAIALAPSNPSVIWVGTGEANIRNDVTPGAGVYLSTDAGNSWKRMGLENAGQIGRIAVDPHDADHVVVAVLGHEWGPNPERGIFVTHDGGKSWKKSLYVNDHTGAIDVVMQPGNGHVLFAATWQAMRRPWTLDDGGPDSGIWRSTDGGDTWTRLKKGLPKLIGRIGLAIAPSDPERVYAVMETPMGDGSLFVSNDLGDHWDKVTDNHALNVRGFYFTTMRVAPDNPDRLYFLGFQLAQSDDGGKTVRVIDDDVHVDHHAMWIDPTDPKRMIQGNDGGAYLTLNGGKTWRFLDGMPIEQSYMVAADTRTPYELCTGLQDNSGWCGPSSSLADSVVSGNDWYTVVGGDGEYTVPAPSDPDIIYANAEDGYTVRFDRKTKQTRSIMPYLHSPGFINDIPTSEQAVRFNWTPPIDVDPNDADTVYLGASKLFKSTDGGRNWQIISPDLTRNDKAKQKNSGGPINFDLSGAETYDTLISVRIAPSDPQTIWAGSDDGVLSLTRDGGKNWSRVTPHGAPEWARIYQIDVSPNDPGVAYVAFDAHKMDDLRPYAYATEDYGKHWRRISDGLPKDGYAEVVRADPMHPDVLAAGTMQGVWISRDRGRHWTRLEANLPTMPVWDLKFVQGDLVLATHGRGLWVLDHFAAVAELDPASKPGKLRLFTPGKGIEFQRWSRGEGAEPAYTAPNAPNGVVVDYMLPQKLEASEEQKKLEQTPVKIEVHDAKGQLIATHYGPSEAGVNRFVWNMRYDGPTKIDFEEQAVQGKIPEWAQGPHGPLVMPGSYNISVSADGHTETAQATVAADPNQAPAPQAQRQSLEAALATLAEADAINRMLNRISALQSQLDDYQTAIAKLAASNNGDDQARARAQQGLAQKAKALAKKLGDLKDAVYNPKVQHAVIEDELHQLTDLHAAIETIAREFAGLGTQAPTPPMLEIHKEFSGKLEAKLAAFNALLTGDVAAYDKAAYAAGAPTLAAGKPIHVAAAPAIH